MEYNFIEIGSKIRSMRKERCWNQDTFIDELDHAGLRISRNTISSIENGEKGKCTLEFLLACSSIFDCDIGYLLGEYTESRTIENQLIHEKTGLSSGAIDNLITGDDRVVEFISFLIESNRIVPVGFKASQCIDFLLEIEHYQNDVLPKLPQLEYNPSLTFTANELEMAAQRTKVITEMQRLQDLHDAKLWRCERDMCTAIEVFVDKEVEKYSQHLGV